VADIPEYNQLVSSFTEALVKLRALENAASTNDVVIPPAIDPLVPPSQRNRRGSFIGNKSTPLPSKKSDDGQSPSSPLCTFSLHSISCDRSDDSFVFR